MMQQIASTLRLLFVYGTLRPGFAGAEAMRLKQEARHLGPAWVHGRLYHVTGYPGLVAHHGDRVHGDLMAMDDPAATLAWIDDYEGCAVSSPQPQEYQRTAMIAQSSCGPKLAWTYVYALPADDLPLIVGGEFLACMDGQSG